MCLPGTRPTTASAAALRAAPADSRARELAAGIRESFEQIRRRVSTPKHALSLTHTYRAGFPVSIYDPPSCFPLLRRDVEGYYSQGWTIQEHSGTHIDMPAHFYESGRTAPELRPDEMLLAAVVIDIRSRTAEEADCALSLDDVRDHERAHGRIPRHAAVLMDSGWAKRVDDGAAFTNRDATGRFAFPGFDPEAVRFLVAERDVACIGVDTLSLDCGSSTTYEAHQEALSADRFGIEALANLDRLPPRGAMLTIGLLPFERGSGAPCHVLARW